MLLGYVSDHPHFLLIQHHTGGVTGVGDEDGTGVFRDKAFDALPLGIPVPFLGAGGQSPDNTARRMDKGRVIWVVRLRDDDLRVGIQNAQAGQKQRFAAAGGDEHIVRLQVHVQFPIIGPDRIDKLRGSRRGRIGQGGAVKIPDGIKIGRRGLQVRLTDVQMMDADAPLLGLDGQRVEFPHGRGFRQTAVCIDILW